VADIQRLQDFAAANGFDLTRPLRHEQVVRLIENWLPRMMFYEDERFHPISLDEVFSMVDETFAALPEAAKDTWRLTRAVRTGTNTFETRTFDPPMVYEPAPLVLGDGLVVNSIIPLDSGPTAENALVLPAADGSTVVSHGATFRRANMFFGPLTTVSGTNTASPGDPFLPRAPQITVMALLENLIDLLKYELAVADASDYPPDGMRGGFDVIDRIIHPIGQPQVFLTGSQKRQILRDMIASFEDETIDPPTLPPGWVIDRIAWDTVTRYAFLEYMFFYAYNDFERYQTAIFDNEHEGDDEGCCLVFDRGVLNEAAVSTDPLTIRRILPFAIITSVHEEYQNADLFRLVEVPQIDPNDPPLARDVVDFTVFIAGGSHATYLTPGSHDLVDFGDYWGWVGEKAPILFIIWPVILAVAILLSIIEHFIDTEDYTSEDGIRGGPPEIVGGDPLAVPTRIVVLPMSGDNHIYLPANEALLRLRAFAGKWGGHAGVVDKSPQFRSKSGRYFRKLLANR
jgi:hypothetical protein